MSVQTLSTDELPDGAADFSAVPPDSEKWALRTVAVVAVCLGVAALAAATFVLSYSPIRAVALQAGVTPRLARGYPLLLDAMLIIVLAAVLALRGAGLPTRLLAWVTLLLVMAAAAGADALHAAGRAMPHQGAAITAAVLPYVLVLIAFALMLAMLRYARLRRVAYAADRASAYGSGWAVALPAAVPGTVALYAEASVPSLARPDMDADPVDDDPGSDGEPGSDDDADTDLRDGEPDDIAPASPGQTVLTAPTELPTLSTEEAGADELDDDPEGPVFHRLFSAPVPPAQPTETQPTEGS